MWFNPKFGTMQSIRKLFVRKTIAKVMLLAFLANSVFGPLSSPFGDNPAFAQGSIPLPTSMISLSSGYAPTLIKGMRVYPDNPLRFDFIVTPGDSALRGQEFNDESTKLMKYFLSSLTVPEKDLWVNLSPYEKDRIIPEAYGKTEMGRDMLAQDYILKQLTASIIYPDSDLGQSFWGAVYQNMQETFGSTEGDVSTFNKIWIVPEKAVVYAKDNVVYVVDSHLKVMLEEDYVAAFNQKNAAESPATAGDVAVQSKDSNAVGSSVFRKMILPAIEKEVNEGQNFASLRQVYHSLILATWFKRNLKESILGKVYVGQNKIDGITFDDDNDKERIYADYVEAFKQGLYNVIKEDEDALTGEVIPRKYFSGGVNAIEVDRILTVTNRIASSAIDQGQQAALFAVELGNNPLNSRTSTEPAAKSKAASMAFNILRENRSTGERENAWFGWFAKNGLDPRTDGRGELVMDELDPLAFNQLRKMIAENAANKNMDSALTTIRPIAEVLVSKLQQEQPLSFSQRVELADQVQVIREKLVIVDELAREVEKAKAQADELNAEYKAATDFMKPTLSKMFLDAAIRYTQMQGRLGELRRTIGEPSLRKELAQLELSLQKSIYLRQMQKYLAGDIIGLHIQKDLLKGTSNLVNSLSESEMASLFAEVRERVQMVLAIFSMIKQDALDMKQLYVTFVFNASEVFSLSTNSDGRKVLQVDLMSFLKEPNRAQIAMWRRDFLNVITYDEHLEKIRKYGRAVKSSFIENNAAVAAEVIRTLIVMKRVVDPYYLSNTPEANRARDQFYADLTADGHYSRSLRLMQELALQTSDSQMPGSPRVRDPIRHQRIETVLNYIKSHYRGDNAVTTERYSQNDIIFLSDIYANALNERWLSGDELDTLDNLDNKVDGGANFIDEIGIEDLLGQDTEVFSENDEKLNLGKNAVQRAAEYFQRVKKSIEDTFSFNVKKYALRGALVIAGIVSIGNVGQGDIINSSQISAEPTVVDNVYNNGIDAVTLERLKLENFNRLRALMANIKELKKLQAQSGKKADPLPDQTTADSTDEPSVGQQDLEKVVAPAIYKVKSGDTLSSIALKVGKKPISGALEIAAANPGIQDPNLIYPDQELEIPGTTTVTMTISEEGTTLKNVVEDFYGKSTPATVKKFIDFNPQLKLDRDLQPGATFTVIMPVKEAQSLKEKDNKFSRAPESSVIVAGGGPVNSDNVGGINLDPTGLDIESIGEDFKFDVPLDPQVLQNLKQEPVNGFVPVILNIVPILNLPQFLGAQNMTEEYKDALALTR